MDSIFATGPNAAKKWYLLAHGKLVAGSSILIIRQSKKLAYANSPC